MKCEIHRPEQGGNQFVESTDGSRYALGLNPDVEPVRAMTLASYFESLPSRSELIKAVEQSGWSFGRELFTSELTKDQNGWGKCASSAAAYAVEKARIVRGQKHRELSDDYLYSLVNGGADRGSTLGENLRTITSRGIAPRSVVGHGDIYRRKYNTAKADKAALRFRAFEGFTVNTEQEVATALLNKVCVVIAIHVGRNWRKFDKNGVLIGDRGMGNHCEHLDDIRYNREKGRFEFRKHSSHGKRYGDGGFCWITFEHLKVHSSHQKYAVPMVIDDPLEDNPFSEGQGDDQHEEQETNKPELIIQSGEFCHWCKKWDREDRAQVVAAGVQVIPGDVGQAGGIPQYRLTVDGKSFTRVGYWSAPEILRKVAELRTQAAYSLA